MVIKESISEIHSFEAYLGDVENEGDYSFIPYINLGVSNHPLNQGTELRYVDYSYMVFFESVIRESFDINEQAESNKRYYFGGLDLISHQHKEYQVDCSKAFLVTFADSKLSSEFWIPIDGLELTRNMSAERVQSFINNDRVDLIKSELF